MIGLEQQHDEKARYQTVSRFHAEHLNRGANGIGCRVVGAGYRACGLAATDHRVGEKKRIGGDFSRFIETDAFFTAKRVNVPGVLFQLIRGGRIQNGKRRRGKPVIRRAFSDDPFTPEQSDTGNTLRNDARRTFYDALILTFGKHDVARVRARSFDQGVKGICRHGDETAIASLR